jgi:hypothetical protein
VKTSRLAHSLRRAAAVTRPAAPTLSAFVRFHRDAHRVAVTVARLRPFVDELLVAADEKVPDSDVQALATIDGIRILRVPWSPPAERANAYLHGQCSGDWVLRVDGDEIVAGRLLTGMRALIADERYTHYHLPRAWLWPGPERMLAERPWWPDLQARLIRNDPALVHFEGAIHTTVQVAGPARILDRPALYHADLLATTRVERERKAARYEAADPGRLICDLPFNRTLYVPESCPGPMRERAVPEEDVAAVAGFLDAPPLLAPARRPRPVPLARHAEVDDLWALRPMPAEAYRARLEIVDPDLRFDALEGRTLLVAVENRGTESWPGGDHLPSVRLSYRWLNADGSVAVPEGLRSALPGPVGPGERTGALLSVVAPPPGTYVLEVDLVEEGVRWFDRPARVAVEVGERLPADAPVT